MKNNESNLIAQEIEYMERMIETAVSRLGENPMERHFREQGFDPLQMSLGSEPMVDQWERSGHLI